MELKKIQKKSDNSKFLRFEMKYILNQKQSENIKKEIQNFMIYDKFTNDKKNYFVRSLYFENHLFNNFHDKIDGLKLRHKFRIRTYSQEFDKNSTIYLELKGRQNEMTYKIRTKIKPEILDLFYNKKLNFKIKNKLENNNLIDKFILETHRKKISPLVLIDYLREPYINNSGIYFRLTFDSNLKATQTNNLFASKNNWFHCIPGYEILEVKFNLTIPAWFQKIIQSHELRRLSVSKFVLGLEHTKLAKDYEGK